MVHEEIDEWRIENRRRVELLTGDGCADYSENARTDDCADAKGSERDRAEGLFESVLRRFGVRDQLVDRLTSEELRQGRSSEWNTWLSPR
jgi:hypothetical protein